MNALAIFALENTLIALLLVPLVLVLARVWRNPPLVHLLWLVVLVKLVCPPLVPVHSWVFDSWVSDLHMAAPIAEPAILPAPAAKLPGDRGAVGAAARDAAAAPVVGDLASTGRIEPARPRLAVEELTLAVWLGGAILWALAAAWRIVRFDRSLAGALPASQNVQGLAGEIAARLGVRRVPPVRYLSDCRVPMVWCPIGRPVIVLPLAMSGETDRQRLEMILAHELAHLRRRDHWVRLVELCVSLAYWWNPLVWLIRRQLHQAEDLCCDGWVRSLFPDCARRYAEILVETAEQIGRPRVAVGLLPASPFLRSSRLKGRIEMILESRFAPLLAGRSLALVALFASFALPWGVQIGTRQASAAPAESPPARQAAAQVAVDAGAPSELPFKVNFEHGAVRFQEADKITIEEVRGTADTFVPGNIYCVKGTYTLASRGRAILLASATVKEPDKGPFGLQDLRVHRKITSGFVNGGYAGHEAPNPSR